MTFTERLSAQWQTRNVDTQDDTIEAVGKMLYALPPVLSAFSHSGYPANAVAGLLAALAEEIDETGDVAAVAETCRAVLSPRV